MNTTGNYTTNQGDLSLEQTGENVNGKYSKTGVLEGSISGNVITGIWKNSGKEGLFEFVFSDHLSFKGKYKIGTEQGNMRSKWDGQITKLNNTIVSKVETTEEINDVKTDYEKKNGTAKWIDEEKNVWEGLWNNNVFVKGKIIFNDGSIEEGEFKDEELNGEGKFTYKDDDDELVVEEGIFKDGNLIKGTILYENGSKSEGEFNEEGLNGEGKNTYKDDDDELVVEEGIFKDGILIKGTTTWEDGTKQEGEFNEEGLNGNGKNTYKDDEDELVVEEGIFKDGNLVKGRILYENGSKSEGEFNEEGLNGEGIRSYKDGCFEKGIFKDGNFIDGNSKKLNDDNLFFEEKWIKGKPVEIFCPDLKNEKNMLIIGEKIYKNGKDAVYENYTKKYTHIKTEYLHYEFSKDKEAANLFGLMLQSCIAFYKLKNLPELPESESNENKKSTQKPVENKNESVLKMDIITSQQETKKEDKTKKIKYDNGLYIGDIDPLTKNRHGYGAYIWNDGNYYEGDFSQNKRTGKGIYIWPNGRYYVGDFIDGKRTGMGKEWDRVLYRYAIGKFVDGKPEKPYVTDYDYAIKNRANDLAAFFKTQARGSDFLKNTLSLILAELPQINTENSNTILKNISCDIIWSLKLYKKDNDKYFLTDHDEKIEITKSGIKISLESIFSNVAPKMINEITQTDFNISVSADINSQLKQSVEFIEERLQLATDSKNSLPYITFKKEVSSDFHENLLKIKGYHPIFIHGIYPHYNYEQFREDIRVIFMGLGLIEQSIKKRSVHDKETFWKLTEKGNQIMVEIKMNKML
jgi:hypothetical protein